MAQEFELRPFRYDNLLAFLALLGLMRALDHARPDWRVRARWCQRRGRGPWVPVVAVADASELTPEDLAAEAERGVLELAGFQDFGGRQKLDFTEDEFRVLARTASGERAEALAALASDGVTQEKKGREEEKKAVVAPTPLCTMFGQGNQYFLERMSPRVATGKGVAVPLERRQDGAELLRRTLIEDWEHQRDPNFGGFRFDPQEDRRYAYQYADPKSRQGKIGTVPGANRLAAVAIPLFTVFPGRNGLRTTAFARHGGAHMITWPIWTVPSRLSAIRHLLAHPELVAPMPRAERLRPHGVAELVRARRISVGRFVNFTRGEPLWGTA